MGEMKDALAKVLGTPPPALVVGTVAKVYADRWTCDVQPEDGGEVIPDVSLRLGVKVEAAAGAFVVPALESLVLVGMVGSRAKLIYAQEVEAMYMLTPAGFGVTVDGAANVITLGARGQTTRSAARKGDKVTIPAGAITVDPGTHKNTAAVTGEIAEGSEAVELS